MGTLPFKKAADVEGEYRIPPRVSKLLLAPKFGGVKNVSMGMNITEVGSMIPRNPGSYFLNFSARRSALISARP